MAQQMAQWVATEDNERQQETRASTNPTAENLTSSKEVLPQPLLDCRQGKINPHNNECGIRPAMGLRPKGDGGDVGSGLDRGPSGVASDGDKESTEIIDNKTSRAIDTVDNWITGALHPINNRDCIHPSNMSLQTNCAGLQSSESTPPPNGASPPLGDQQLVNWESTSPHYNVHARAQN
jgi:hypothetical protein